MTTQFLSRVDRIDKDSIPIQTITSAGPGSYDHPNSLKSSLPGFAPFTTTSKRADIVNEKFLTPAPGTYDTSETMLKKSLAASTSFRSKTQRFSENKKEETFRPNEDIPLPPQKTQLKRNKKPEKNTANQSLEILKSIMPSAAPPSIPTRFQSYGYEEDPVTGNLSLQKPLDVYYSGEKGDSIGPGSYNLKRNINNGHFIDFGKVSSRTTFVADLEKKSSLPGPGQYNSYSDFDIIDASKKISLDRETDFVLQLHAARTKPSSNFASRTKREGIQIKADIPGPGDYYIPPAIRVSEPPPPEIQSFGTTGPRFQDNVSRSMRLNTAPGQYNPLTSDFDKDKISVLKQKKMTSRSGWAQNIAFASTESRFVNGSKDCGPSPLDYTPKTSLADSLPRQNPRSGPFGSTVERFSDNKVLHPPRREEIAARELESEMNQGQESIPRDNYGHRQPTKPKFSRPFASKEQRFPLEKEPEAPAPTAYYVTPDWNHGGTKIAPPTTLPTYQYEHLKKRKEVETNTPGPGQYFKPSSIIPKSNNRKNILISTSPRDGYRSDDPATLPGPGSYNIQTSLKKQSHNVYLSEGY